nr:unnamed protein product [Callosobruchus analis]
MGGGTPTQPVIKGGGLRPGWLLR